jgi:hypothetical protein
MQVRIDKEETSMRLGLGLISMLADKFEIAADSDGTEVRVQLPLTS